MGFDLTSLAIIGFIIFFILFLVFLVLYLDDSGKLIKPEKCPKISSTYSVIPNVNTSEIRPTYNCTTNPNGTLGTLICNFSGISTLNLAIDTCNLYGSNCSGFAYNVATGTMVIIDTSYGFTTDTVVAANNYDVYINQTLN
jgi:hypothetical protein